MGMCQSEQLANKVVGALEELGTVASLGERPWDETGDLRWNSLIDLLESESVDEHAENRSGLIEMWLRIVRAEAIALDCKLRQNVALSEPFFGAIEVGCLKRLTEDCRHLGLNALKISSGLKAAKGPTMSALATLRHIAGGYSRATKVGGRLEYPPTGTYALRALPEFRGPDNDDSVHAAWSIRLGELTLQAVDACEIGVDPTLEETVVPLLQRLDEGSGALFSAVFETLVERWLPEKFKFADYGGVFWSYPGSLSDWDCRRRGRGECAVALANCLTKLVPSIVPRRECPSGTAATQDAIAAAEKKKGTKNNQGTPKKKPKDAKAMLVAALSAHHGYGLLGSLMLEPIGLKELAVKAGVAQSTASTFMRDNFGMYDAYKNNCQRQPPEEAETRLKKRLNELNGDVPQRRTKQLDSAV